MPATVANRLNTLLLLLLVLMAGTIIAILATRVAGGPLDPPAAPASTDGVREPGTPISSLPFTINQPGFYYLTRNLNATAAGNGITITSSQVTLDLKGFTLGGLGSSDGIEIPSAPVVEGTVIRNGIISDWGIGIWAQFSHDAEYDSLVFRNNTQGLDTGDTATLRDCVIFGGSSALVLRSNSTMRGCTINLGNAPVGVAAEGNTDIVDNHFAGHAFGSFLQANGNDIRIRDNFFATTGPQVAITAASNKVFLLGNFLSCSGITDGNPSANYHILNGEQTEYTNWCY